MSLFKYSLNILFLLSGGLLIGMEESDSDLINRSVQDTLFFIEGSVKENTLSNEQLALQRTNFLSQIQRHNTLLNQATCSVIVACFYDRKKHYLANNKEAPIFINDALFKEICPLLINNQSLKKRESRQLFYSFFSDPEKINELIYKYCKFPPLTKIHKAINTGFNGIIKFINFFKKKENEFELIKIEGCNILIEGLCEYGFYKGDTLYKGTNPLTIFNENLHELPCAKDQTLEGRIDYLKTAFEPRCYNAFNPENFSGDLKKSVHTFLLCLKRYEKKLHLKVPKYVRLSILAQLEKYRLAQKVRSKLLNHIQYYKESQVKKELQMKDDMEQIFNFFCNDLLVWFDKEALR